MEVALFGCSQLLEARQLTMGKTMGTKGIIGIGGCLLGLAIVYFGSGIGTESPKKEAAAGASAPVQKDNRKPLRAANFALDNMVFFAQDLGFTVTNAKDEPISPSKIATRIESQLQNVRELYRLELDKNPALAGMISVQFEIASSGEVSQVKEAVSRIANPEFKKAVIAEVAKWSFTELLSENIKVNCPLLFVHQGMDITTLVRWEKATATGTERSTLLQAGTAVPANQTKTAVRTAPTLKAAAKPAPVPTTEESVSLPSGQVFQIKYATLLRKEPNFTAPALTSFTIGTKVVVQKRIGDWLEVRSTDSSQIGYIRKEFVTSFEVNSK